MVQSWPALSMWMSPWESTWENSKVRIQSSWPSKTASLVFCKTFRTKSRSVEEILCDYASIGGGGGEGRTRGETYGPRLHPRKGRINGSSRRRLRIPGNFLHGKENSRMKNVCVGNEEKESSRRSRTVWVWQICDIEVQHLTSAKANRGDDLEAKWIFSNPNRDCAIDPGQRQ